MSKFSTVLWDIGGVLLTNGWDHNQRKTVFDALHLEDREEFERRHAELNDPWEKGAIDFDQYLAQTMFFREQPFTPAAMRQAIEAQSVVLADTAMPILKDLHATGRVQMGQLNNESRELNDMRLDRFGLKQYLSTFFCSGYVALRKPDPKIYRLALEVLQKPAQEVIFIDDRPKNAEAATSLGMHGIAYTGSAALRAELTALGLL
ncbi:HAD-IA family hydrolase [Acidipila sp. EB88]|uniref:HAD-IA family hydrolase n=1 Tax=Acidipila sp. EB88 TaxID=2305226 RepID=UPI000F5FB18B|nr:HAD-IA family hydrolase [Acidipila sp. EB88]RRA47704.1 HAD family hydrolase [Acidipila sp. EB88]